MSVEIFSNNKNSVRVFSEYSDAIEEANKICMNAYGYSSLGKEGIQTYFPKSDDEIVALIVEKQIE